MSKYNFTAKYGVEFGEHVTGKTSSTPGPYSVWAKFERARDLETRDGEKVFAFGTDDAKVADRLRGVNDYGITETSAQAPAAEPDSE